MDAFLEFLSDLHAFRMTQSTVECDGGDARFTQAVDLILHQGDQRTDHDVETFCHQRGELVGQALSASRRHHQQGILSREIAANRLLLKWTKGVISPVRGEHVEDGVHGPSPFRRPDFDDLHVGFAVACSH